MTKTKKIFKYTSSLRDKIPVYHLIIMEKYQSQSIGKSVTTDVRSRLDELNLEFEGSHPDRVLRWGYDTFGRGMALGTGFGRTGILLLHRVSELGLDIPLFFLDTQLLFAETYALRTRLENKLGIRIEAVKPDVTPDEQAVRIGPELWNSNPDRCCHIRKIAPLRRYLAGKNAWITGIRRQQSVTRRHTRLIEYDAVNDVIKLNPLAAHGDDEIREYIIRHDLPYNPLHDEGFPSIGCTHCTSRVWDGEHERAGRWRGGEKLECGIHNANINRSGTM
jgi:phosphoadenosine phosphosulfate reductase